MPEILQQAKDHRKANRFEEAVILYETAYNDPNIILNNWDIWGYVHSLRKTGHLEKSIELSEKHIVEYPEFSNLKNNLVWAHFDKSIRKFDSHKVSETEHALERIYSLQGQVEITDESTIPCPFTVGAFKVLKAYKKPNFNTSKIRYWLDKLDPLKLSKKEQTTVSEDTKERKLASDFENYYSYLATLLYKERKFQESIEVSEFALANIQKLHYDNNIWFKRRIALCYIELGDLSKGEEILKSLDTGKGDKWFIESDISLIYFEQNDYEKALRYALKAAKNLGDDLMKINLYVHLARIFFKLQKPAEAKVHAELIIAIKQANDARIDLELQKLITYFKLDISQRFDLRNKKREAEKIWDEYLFEGQEKLTGTINKILPNGKAGFIKQDSSRETYYFNFSSVKARKQDIKEGKSVKFFLKNSFDKKKNKESKEAIEIVILK
jgi:tetratricopeptide (TPR) repeat protein